MHTQNMSFWRKVGLVIALPFVLLILLPYAYIADKFENWKRTKKRT